MRSLLARCFWTALAALFLVEAWLWDVLGVSLGRLFSFLPIDSFRRGLRNFLVRAPAGVSVTLFLAPVLIILPFKLLGVALIAKGRIVAGGCVFLLAKTVGLALTAFLFDLCRDRLMTLRWFERVYAAIIGARDWANRQVAPYRATIIAFRERLVSRAAARSPAFARRLMALRACARARLRRAI